MNSKKEKVYAAYAQSLIYKFSENGIRDFDQARKCAILCVKELTNNSSEGCYECGGGSNLLTHELEEVMKQLDKL